MKNDRNALIDVKFLGEGATFIQVAMSIPDSRVARICY